MKLDPDLGPLENWGSRLNTLEERRQDRCKFFAERLASSPKPDNLIVEDLVINGPAQSRIAIRIYTPQNHDVTGAMLYIHGGGFALGNLDFEHQRCVEFAQGAGCVVVAPDYRLAPEHPYPAAIDDCYATLLWMHESFESLGFDLPRLAVGGTSAGGALAAAVTLMARDRHGPNLRFQLLDCPVLDDRMISFSARAFTNVEVFQRNQMEKMWEWYLGPHAGNASPYAAPMRAESCAGLPDAYILAAGVDPLRDEAIAYASRLMEADVGVELHVIPRVPHGFDALAPASTLSRRAFAEMVGALRKGLSRED